MQTFRSSVFSNRKPAWLKKFSAAAGRTRMKQKNASPNLRELQEWLRWAITDPRGAAGALEDPHPADRGDRYQAPPVDVLEMLESTEDASVEERVSVYAEAYFSRIVESLE